MVKKEISSVQNWKETFWETAVCSVNSSQRIRALPWRHLPLRLLLWNLKSDIWKRLDGYGENEISSIKNWKEDFWETSLYSVNSSKSYSFPLQKPFAKSVLVKFSKWYLEGHKGLRWKRKYPKIKTLKKVFEKLLCVLLIHLTELQLSPQEAFR